MKTDVARILRGQSWERAKGELQSMLCTFYTPENARPGQYDEIEEAITEFIQSVENNSLHE